MNLFRAAATAPRFQSHISAPLQLPSRQLRWVAIVLLSIAVVGAWFVGQRSYGKKLGVSGYTEPAQGITKVYPPVVGTVRELQVREGAWVVTGQRLLSLDLQRHLGVGSSASVQLVQRIEQELLELQLRERLLQKQLRVEGHNLEQRVAAQQAMQPLLSIEARTQGQRRDLLAAHVAAVDTLHGQGVVSRFQLNELRAEQFDLERQQAVLARQRLQQRLELSLLQSERQQRDFQLNLSLSQLRGERLGLQRQLTQVHSDAQLDVVAPVAGFVSFLQAQVGQRVGPAQPLLNLVDGTAKQSVVLLLPSQAAAQVAAGLRVSLRYAGLPLRQTGLQWGEIVSISDSPVAPNDLAQPIPLTEPTYRALVQLDGASAPDVHIVPGMVVQADVVLRRAPLWRWLVQPFVDAWVRT